MRRGGRVLQVPLTYRGAPLAGAEEHLVTLMEHSVLGRRWVYHAAADPIALECFTRVLRGEQAQADLEIHAADGSISTMEPPIRIRVEGTAPATGTGAPRLSDELTEPVSGAARLIADWPDGTGVVAALG